MPVSRAKGVLFVAAALVCASSAVAAAMLPSPTGPHPVGRRVLRWIDQSRHEVLSRSTTDKREVIVWVWYPAAPQPAAKIASYVEELEQVAEALSRAEASLARKGEAHAFENAPVASDVAPWPVVFFSPGSGMLPGLYATFCEELASRGYVVAGIDHPYDDRAVLLSDGRVVTQAKQPSDGETLLRFERERVTVRTQDLEFALDQFERIRDGELTDPLRGHIDLSHVGVFGHSVGGMTAAQFCQEDARVGACGNLDGVVAAMPAYAEPLRGIARPFLFIQKPFPAVKGESPETAAQRVGRLRAKSDNLFAGVRSGHSYRVTIAGATHESFSDIEVLTRDSPRDRELLVLARDYVRAFFDRTLKGEKGTLLDREPEDGAVRVESFDPR